MARIDNSLSGNNALALLDAVLSNLQFGALLISSRFTILAASEAASVRLGQSRRGLVGQSLNRFPEFFHVFHADGAAASCGELPIRRAIHLGEIVSGEQWVFEDRGGRRIPILIGAKPVRNDAGEIVGAVVSWTDVTVLKSIETRLREALETDALLLQEVNHRTKNYFQLLASLVQLEAANRGPDVTDFAKRIEARLAVLAAAHEGLYAPGRNDSIMAEDLLASVVRVYCTDNLTVTADCDPVELPRRQITPVALAVNEAVNNAVKHAFPGGRGGIVQVELRQADRRDLVLTIVDNGVGIPAVRQTGLGLTVLKALAHQLSGRIDLHQRPEGGTEVALTFPQADPRP